MGKKIMVLCGSPVKDGNTNTVVNWISQGVKESGSQIEVVDVTKLKYKTNGCTACMGCQESDKFECVIKDEAALVLARIPENDILLFATPLYFFGPTAQLKVFIDRMYSLFKFNPETGQFRHNLGHMTFGVVSTAGGESFGSLKEMFNITAGFIGTPIKWLLIPLAGRSGDIKAKPEIKEKAIAFGRELC